MFMSQTLSLSETTSRWLLANGYTPVNLDCQRENGDTALMKATRQKELTVVKELIDRGVNLNLRNDDGNNALWYACFGNDYILLDLLINSGININNQNDHGATVLMYAASAGKEEMVQFLLSYGADTDLKNIDDFKPIDFASTVEVLRILKNAKNSETRQAESPAHEPLLFRS
ncbi:ankyrin [Limnoraphis robusta CS-951]|uniref:Ankyrin n=2 Tax=Limnoraphis TaxID=1332112 RepID=A0A0F5Y8N6_9CYAN|nr:ankyrin [Limnoraphis robusta CS-951]